VSESQPDLPRYIAIVVQAGDLLKVVAARILEPRHLGIEIPFDTDETRSPPPKVLVRT
jgi:hypothetical protein